jgi:adenylate kinase
MRVVLFGPPGSGKGTQGAFLAEHFGVPRLAPGDILRENVRAGTSLGRQAESWMSQGKLVPDELIIDLVRERLAEPDAAHGFVMDGFPRTLAQAEALDALLRLAGERLLRVIYLKVSEAEVVRRLGNRWTCPACQRVYSDEVPARTPGVCDEDGTELVQRDDDKPEAIRTRTRVYLEETLPVLDHYHALDLVSEVDGELPVEVIRQQLLALLEGDVQVPFEAVAS